MTTQASRRVSAKTIEETYTDNDVPHVINEYGCKSYPTYNISIGHLFDYPMRWLNDKSDYKAIAIRRLQVIPTNHNLNFTMVLYPNCYGIGKYIDEETQKFYVVVVNYDNRTPIMVPLSYKITYNNSLDEILADITDQINVSFNQQTNSQIHLSANVCVYEYELGDYNEEIPLTDYINDDYFISDHSYTLVDDAQVILNKLIRFNYSFDDSTNILKFHYTTFSDTIAIEFNENTGPQSVQLDFHIADHDVEYPIESFDGWISKFTMNASSMYNIISGDTDDNKVFLQFLNQDVTKEALNYLIQPTSEKIFHDVWNRVTLQVHASFSDNNRNFIGLSGDFYEKPSVLYEPPTNASNFSIYFTADGRHRILLRYCRFFIGLCFIRNYNTSLATK